MNMYVDEWTMQCQLVQGLKSQESLRTLVT